MRHIGNNGSDHNIADHTDCVAIANATVRFYYNLLGYTIHHNHLGSYQSIPQFIALQQTRVL
eukprot:1031674-Pyramimonas_sp.AAC.1